MLVSLIVTTRGRLTSFQRLLSSLQTQTYPHFELIVVDQSTSGDVHEMTSHITDFPIQYVKVQAMSLSRARNTALKMIRGEVVGFPDDDCWYPHHLLATMTRLLTDRSEIGGVTGKSVNSAGLASSGKWDPSPGRVSRHNVLRRGTSYTIFLRRTVIETVGPFDEELGVGAPTGWGSGEDVDYLLRAISAGFVIMYQPGLHVFHERPARLSDPQKALRYGMGLGRLLRKHSYPVNVHLYYWARSIGGLAVCLFRLDLQGMYYYYQSLRGRIGGALGVRY